MKSITFNTPASNRVTDKAKRLIKGAWACSASLGTKRKTVNGTIEDDQEQEIVAKLKALKCTSIKVEPIKSQPEIPVVVDQTKQDLIGCVQMLNEIFKWSKVKDGKAIFSTSEETFKTYQKFVSEIKLD